MSSRCKTLADVVNVVDTCNKVRLAAMQVLCNAMGHGDVVNVVGTCNKVRLAAMQVLRNAMGRSLIFRKNIMQVCNST